LPRGVAQAAARKPVYLFSIIMVVVGEQKRKKI
jgi:hypothetical protein